jgi:hypothetical protein
MHRNHTAIIDKILASRGRIPQNHHRTQKSAEEGGCGVTGFIASVPVRGRHIYEPSIQMHNRGNGKGGGIAAVGLSADDLGVAQEVLDTHYMLQVALLDPSARPEIEAAHIEPYLDVHKTERLPTVDDYRDIEGLEVRPPDVSRYFVRVKKEASIVLSKPINSRISIRPRRRMNSFTRIRPVSTRRFTRLWVNSGPLCFPMATT